MSQLLQIVAVPGGYQELIVETLPGSGSSGAVTFGAGCFATRRDGASRNGGCGTGAGDGDAVGVGRGAIGIAVALGEADGLG